MLLFMKARDVLKLPIADDVRQRTQFIDPGILALKESLLKTGWLEDMKLMICDGKVSAGFRRWRALQELLNEDKISGDFLVSVQIRRTMMVPMLLDVTEPPPFM